MKQQNYGDIRHTLKSGDLICFGGRGPVSLTIKFVTQCNVSHVGIVLETYDDYCNNQIVQVIESTTITMAFSGVQINRMSTRLDQYKGRVWILPMLKSVRKSADMKAYFNWLMAQKGKSYDVPQALMAGLDDILPDPEEDFSQLYCSELCSGALQEANAIDKSINASTETPKDNILYKIWDNPYQLKGKLQELI